MNKKRNYRFVFSDNTKEEEFEAKKNFTLMLTRTIFKKGFFVSELIAITIFLILLYINWKVWILFIAFVIIISLIIIILNKDKLWKK